MGEVSVNSTFEFLRDSVSRARKAEYRDRRFMHWVGEGRRFAYSRDSEGRVELFISGVRLVAHSKAVARRIDVGSWRDVNGACIVANRLVFPGGAYVDAFAAAIMTELLRRGIEEDVQRAFSLTEPLIALAFRGDGENPGAVTGLAAELLLLEGIVKSRRFSDDEISRVWKGYARSSRDFMIGSTGVEVKATTLGVSRHHIQGWYQVEPGVPADKDVLESRLFLLSVGLEWLPVGVGGRTIEGILKGMSESLPDFVWRDVVHSACQYCGENYYFDFNGVNSDEAFRRPFSVGFVRMYDLAHEGIDILRSVDVHGHPHVVGDSVSFDVVLPEFIDRTNPICGFPAVMDALVKCKG